MKRLWIMIVVSILLLASLTCYASNPLSQDVGQMMMVGFRGTSINIFSPIVLEIEFYHIGGVILFDHENIGRHILYRNITSPQQLKKLTAQLQYYAKMYNDYPLLIAVNQEGGMINTLHPSKGFKLSADYSQQKLGKLKDPALIYQQAYHRGLLLKHYGINLNLAPVAALNINPNSQAIGKWQRSYGVNPQRVTQDLTSAIQGYHHAGIGCTLKHFPGLGSSTHNTDFDAANVTATWTRKELIPYAQLIKQHHACDLIMVAHSINTKLNQSNLPSSLSKQVVTHLLRNQLHYQGVIITDDMDAAAIRNHYSTNQAIKHAILAGNDIILYGGSLGYSPSKDAAMLYATMMRLAKSNPHIRSDILQATKKIELLKQGLKSQ